LDACHSCWWWFKGTCLCKLLTAHT
jgi:hypothetical protein